MPRAASAGNKVDHCCVWTHALLDRSCARATPREAGRAARRPDSHALHADAEVGAEPMHAVDEPEETARDCAKGLAQCARSRGRAPTPSPVVLIWKMSVCTFFVLIMMPPSSLMWLGQKGNHGIAGSGEARGMDLPLEENVVDSGPLFDFRLNSRASLTHKHRIPPLIFINC